MKMREEVRGEVKQLVRETEYFTEILRNIQRMREQWLSAREKAAGGIFPLGPWARAQQPNNVSFLHARKTMNWVGGARFVS